MPSVSNNPLQLAIGRGCVECIRILVDSSPCYGVDSCIGPEGLLPVHVAAREGHLQVLRYLQTSGACLQGIDAKGSNGLHYAARAGQQRSVRWLLRHGVHPVLNTSLESPSHIASQLQHMEIVSILSKHTATGNINTSNNNSGEDPKQLDSGNSSLSSSTNPPSSLTTTTTTTNSTACSCIVNSSSSSSSSSSTSSSDEINNYTIRSVNSFFLHPPKGSTSSSSSTSGSNPNSSSFYLHPRLITSAIEEEATYSTTITNNHSHSHFGSGSNSNSNNSNSTKNSSEQQAQGGGGQNNQKPSFRLHSSPPPSNSSLPSSGGVGVGGEPPSISLASFHLHDDQNISSISVQQSLDYSIETTMAPVNNQFVISSPVVVQSDPIDIGKFINHNNNKHNNNNNSSSKNKNGAPGGKMGGIPPPPPPPMPPMPMVAAVSGNNFKAANGSNNSNGKVGGKIALGKSSSAAAGTTTSVATDLNVKQIVREKEKVLKCVSVNGISATTTTTPPPIENDYEDIEEFQKVNNSEKVNNNSSSNNGEIINRNPPPPPLPMDNYNNNNNNNNNYNNNNNTYNSTNNINSNNNNNINNNKILAGLKKLNVNGKQVPFIPPQFPTPPQQDQLIKPSEYLKSIKTKTNLKGTLSHGPRLLTGNNINSSSNKSEIDVNASSKADETNAEDEFEEINPEVKVGNGAVTPPPPPPGSPSKIQASNINGIGNGGGGGGGMIRPEELMKVNLRKTPTTRTKSAPPLGRVLNNGESVPMKAELSSPTYGKTQPPLNTKAAVIAELEQSSQLGGVREWKEELRRRQLEEEKNAVKELAQHYSPLNFVAEVPDTDTTGAAIPPWKRLLVAKKAAERARKEAEEQLKMDTEAKRMASIPPWRKQLLQRRESTFDGKCAQ